MERSPAGGHEDGTYLTFFAATESLVPLAFEPALGRGQQRQEKGDLGERGVRAVIICIHRIP